jgi:hypothetical protein
MIWTGRWAGYWRKLVGVLPMDDGVMAWHSDTVAVEAPVTQLDNPYCTATLYADRVEYRFHRSDKNTVDAFIDTLDQVLLLRYPDGVYTGMVRLLYDVRVSDALPFYWLFSRALEWRKKHPQYAPSEVRMAVLFGPEQRFHDTMFLRMVEQFSPLFSRKGHRFGLFEDDYQAALTWLHGDVAPDHLRDVIWRSF